VIKRGEEIPRPKPWKVRAANLAVGKGWDQLKAQAESNLDAAWVAMTSEPRRTDQRQHQLKGSLGEVSVGGVKLDQWQIEVTSAGRVFYAIDDENRTLWVTEATTGHPKSTDSRQRRKRG
jgi:hypothetical protein